MADAEKPMSREFFRKIAERASTEMDRAFHCYYPVEGNNDIPEAITAAYLAFQLRDAGYFIYPQVQCSDCITNHLDFAAINPKRRAVVLVEAKRVYSSERAKLLGADWRRLQRASIVSELRHVPKSYAQYVCLLATTWNDTFREWWSDPKRPLSPGRCNSADWADIRDALSRATVNVSVHVPLARLQWNSQLHVLFSFIRLSRQGPLQRA